ncbi:hypothetical protein B0H19DRAFT_1083317 [Mycena capillaripes]|nr:hypothetical protein B0H19DRAFT_1083317 [Mycena capillaripes]
MLTLSNLAALLLASAVAVKAAVFAVYPGWDMNNGGFSTTFVGTELDCMNSCAANGGCIAYAYVPYGPSSPAKQPECVLKGTIDPSTFKIQPFDVSSGLLKPCGSFPVDLVGPTECFNVTLV